jgi:hypothetical protein
MLHLVMLTLAGAIFALLFAFVAACERLIARPDESEKS